MLLSGRALTIATLLRLFPARIGLTWALTLVETTLMAIIPLFIGFAVDGLLSGRVAELIQLAAVLATLIAISVGRRIYDTRVYGTIRAEFGQAQMARGAKVPISALNARLGMGRELVEFLEETLPMVMAGVVQLLVAIVILYLFAPRLAVSAGVAAILVAGLYTLFHRRFYRLNRALNQQTETQVRVLERRALRPLRAHLWRLRQHEVRISDTEAILYGLVFLVLLAAILFNLWYATTALAVTTGAIFSIVSYSWDFIDGTLTVPVTLQHWTRLAEIMQRLNAPSDATST